MFRMKHYAHFNQHLHTAGASFVASQERLSAQAAHALTAHDYAWEFGWSFNGGDWLRRCDPEPMQASPLDKALALAG
jgi:hypothetical protein